jgi:hypothetical protein
MVKPAPFATRAELDETIAEIRAKKADGWSIDYYWTAEQGTIKRTGEVVWGLHRVPLSKYASPKSMAVVGQDEQYHINEAIKRNRALPKRAIKVISAYVTDVRESVV